MDRLGCRGISRILPRKQSIAIFFPMGVQELRAKQGRASVAEMNQNATFPDVGVNDLHGKSVDVGERHVCLAVNQRRSN